MNNFSTRSQINHYYNDERKWELSDLEESEEESDNEGLINFKLRKKTKCLVISSLDRNWTDINNKETPYKFNLKIDCGSINTNFNISHNLKNIIGLQIIKMILHNKPLNIEYTSEVEHLTNNPYMIVDVSGFNNSNNGTNQHLNAATSIMISLTPIQIHDTGVIKIKSLEYKNINNSKIEYPITPLSSINSFNVTIKNNIGFDPSKNIQDVLEIDGIVKDGVGTNEYMYIQTKNFFSDDFQIGDTILVKNYKNVNDVTSNGISFNNFINRDEGHKIIEITNTTGALNPVFKNIIKISKPYTINVSDGTLTDEPFFTSLIINTLDLIDKTNQTEVNNNGILINVNLQSSLFINVETLEKENTITPQLI